MLPPLRDDDRNTLHHVSVMLCCSSLALLPLATGTSWIAQAQASPATAAADVPATPERLRFPEIRVRRDPFVPDAAASPQRGLLFVGAGGGAEHGLQMPIVHAVVLGAKPEALIEISGIVRVVGIGDALEDAAVTAIDTGGVVLSDGRTLPLEQPQHV